MTILLILALLCGLLGYGARWLVDRPKLRLLARLTDRDERGRFVRREAK